MLAATPGDFGKPRPHVVVQTNLVIEDLGSITLCPLTSSLRAASAFRVAVAPSEETGLRVRSQIMVDKIVTVRRDRVRERIGRIDEITEADLNRRLIVFLGLG